MAEKKKGKKVRSSPKLRPLPPPLPTPASGGWRPARC